MFWIIINEVKKEIKGLVGFKTHDTLQVKLTPEIYVVTFAHKDSGQFVFNMFSTAPPIYGWSDTEGT